VGLWYCPPASVVRPWTLVGATPWPGSLVALGMVILLAACSSSGYKRGVVPDLVCMSTAEASAALAEAGLKSEVRLMPPVPPLGAGVVINETPFAGSHVPVGTVVRFQATSGTRPGSRKECQSREGES
jgi:beta-lactam-binding protein with PASTA domain